MRLFVIPILFTLSTAPALANSCQEFKDRQEEYSRQNELLFDKYEKVKKDRDLNKATNKDVCQAIYDTIKLRKADLENDINYMNCDCKYNPEKCSKATSAVAFNKEQLANMTRFAKKNCSIKK